MRGKTIIIARLIEKIKRFPITFEGIQKWVKHENIKISERTLYRYLEEIGALRLNDGHIQMIDGETNRKIWKFEYDNSARELGENDIRSFLLLKNLAPNILTEKRMQSITKLEDMLYKAQSKSKFEYHFGLTSHGTIRTSNFSGHIYDEREQQNLDTFIWAIQNNRKARILETATGIGGDSGGLSFPLNVLPMQILYHKGAIFLQSLTETTKELLSLDLTQIKRFDIQESVFDPGHYVAYFREEAGKRFGVEPNLDATLYNITLEFSPEMGEYINNRVWHASQKVIRKAHGKWEFRLNCGINNELIDWIFQWDSKVRVVKPKRLKALLFERFMCVKESYLRFDKILVFLFITGLNIM